MFFFARLAPFYSFSRSKIPELPVKKRLQFCAGCIPLPPNAGPPATPAILKVIFFPPESITTALKMTEEFLATDRFSSCPGAVKRKIQISSARLTAQLTKKSNPKTKSPLLRCPAILCSLLLHFHTARITMLIMNWSRM